MPGPMAVNVYTNLGSAWDGAFTSHDSVSGGFVPLPNILLKDQYTWEQSTDPNESA